MSKKSWIRYLTLLFGILCISWSAIFVRTAAISGLGSAFYRLAIGTAGLIPIWLIRKKSKITFQSAKVAILCGIFFACDLALWNTSILITKAAIATLLANLAPIWVGLGAWFLLKEKVHPVFWTGTAFSIAGVIVMMGPHDILSSGHMPGMVLAIVASMFYGAYLLIVRFGRSSLDTLSFTAISMITSSIVLFILCLVFRIPLSGFSAKTWISLTGLGLISQLSGWLAINYTLRYIKPTVASVSLLSQTVFTAILSVPLLGEFLSVLEISGMFLVLSGIYLVNRDNLKIKMNFPRILSVRTFKKSR